MSEGASGSPMRNAVQRLLRPRSVAIVGASATPGALGASVIANLERMRFAGDVYLINPSRDAVGTRRCLRSVEELPIGVDVAVLAIPRIAVLDTIRSLALRQAGAAIIFSAGFAEGGESGRAEQHEMARIATGAGMIIEGPNCLGLVNYVEGVALTFVETPAIALGPRAGIAIVSQSGAMAAVMSVMLSSKELGISYSISTGNEAVTGVEDYLEYLLEDSHTQVIALVVEQFRQPGRFLRLARSAQKKGKALVLLHPGKSRAARESAATHTGALAGDYAVMRSRVGREGVLLAESLEEFVDVLDVMMRCPVRPSGGVGVLTESGAFKALTLDLCEEIGLSLPMLTDASAASLRAALPEFVPVSNPVDLTAQGLSDPGLYRLALAALLADDRFGCIILVIIQTDAKTCAIKLPTIIDTIRTLGAKKPIVLAGLDEGAQVPAQYIAQLRALHVPYFPSSGRAFRAVARICSQSEQETGRNGPAVPRHQLDLSGGGVIPEYRAKEQLQRLGIRFPSGRIAKTLDEATQIATELGYPVALKAQSGELPHKSDVGGVVLNVADANSISTAWSRLRQNIARHRPGLELDGVLVESMSPPGVELIIGGRNDSQWGPVVLAGFGGVQAEILKDARLMAPDLSSDEIIRELYMLRSGELLRGFRGSPPLDVEAVAYMISQIGGLLAAEPSIQEIDLNPVIVYPRGSGAIALDALIVASVSDTRPA
jgi:acetate---CoA ligase (ADP-forming)